MKRLALLSVFLALPLLAQAVGKWTVTDDSTDDDTGLQTWSEDYSVAGTDEICGRVTRSQTQTEVERFTGYAHDSQVGVYSTQRGAEKAVEKVCDSK